MALQAMVRTLEVKQAGSQLWVVLFSMVAGDKVGDHFVAVAVVLGGPILLMHDPLTALALSVAGE